MRGLRFSGRLSLAMIMFQLALGCGTNGSPEARNETPEGNDSPVASDNTGPRATSRPKNSKVQTSKLSDVFASWENGDKEKAVELLRSISWNDAALTSDSPVLSLGEQEFMSLSQSKRTRLQKEAIEFTKTSRKLARHAISLGQAARESGDKQKAKIYFEEVLSLGQALSSSQRLMLVQMVGKAVVNMAHEELSTLQ